MLRGSRDLVWLGAALLFIFLVALGLFYQPLIAVALAVALFLIVLTAKSPQAGVALWLAITVMVPNWLSLPVVGLNMRPLAAVGLPVLAGLMLSRVRRHGVWVAQDACVLGAAGLILAMAVPMGYPLFLIANLVLVTILSYLLGRLADVEAAQRSFVFLMLGVSLWGILEFLTGYYVVRVLFPSENEIQVRGGFFRSEAAFGHSIAYGAALALAIPMTTKLRHHVLSAQLVLAGGILVSLSRGPMLALLLGLLMTVTLLTPRRRRASLGLLIALVTFAIWAAAGLFYSGATAIEVASSSTARVNQFELLFESIKPFEPAGAMEVLADGSLAVSGVAVIDSAPLRLAANYGWVPALLLLSPVFFALAGAVRLRLPSAISLLAQVPVLVVTSLITQWGALLFFVSGMMAAELSKARMPSRNKRREHLEGQLGQRGPRNKSTVLSMERSRFPGSTPSR